MCVHLRGVTLIFRIVWRGGPSVAENVASGLQKVPMVVSAAIVAAVPLSCGAASLTAGAAFYAFMVLYLQLNFYINTLGTQNSVIAGFKRMVCKINKHDSFVYLSRYKLSAYMLLMHNMYCIRHIIIFWRFHCFLRFLKCTKNI